MNWSYKIIFYKKLPQSLTTDFENLMKRSFPWRLTGKKKQEEHDKFCSKKDQKGFVLALNNNQIIGAVIILKRRIKFNNVSLILGGIGGVSIMQEYRRHGLATALLKKAMEMLKEEKCDLAYLCTFIEKLGKLYKPFGFVALKRPHIFLGKSGKKYTEYDAMIAPVNSQEKFKAILTDDKPFDIGRGNW